MTTVWPLEHLCAELRGMHKIAANEAADRLEGHEAVVERLNTELANAYTKIGLLNADLERARYSKAVE